MCWTTCAAQTPYSYITVLHLTLAVYIVHLCIVHLHSRLYICTAVAHLHRRFTFVYYHGFSASPLICDIQGIRIGTPRLMDESSAAIETRVSDESPVAMETSPENHSPVQNGLHDRTLPKFAFVSLLAGIFDLENPLQNNRFLCQVAH